MATRIRILILLGFIMTATAIGALVRRLNPQPAQPQPTAAGTASANSPSSAPTPTAALSPSPSARATLVASPSPAEASSPGDYQAPPSTEASPVPEVRPPVRNPASLIIPVAGVTADQLQDTFTAARSQGRSHDAIDIMAPKGTPVLAAADGAIVKLFLSKPGGITIYQLGTDNKTIYYYAHLDRYADGLAEGHFARRGETIAYVGDTGNAGPGNYHLHFSISLVEDPKRYWQGVNINPYPLLNR